MPLTISSVALAEKNKLSSDGIWYLALRITVPGLSDPIQIVRNNENVQWPTGSGPEGTWIAFPFELDEIGEESSGEVPQVELRISNISRVMEQYLQTYDEYVKSDGFSPIEMNIYVINSKNLASSTPEVEHVFELIQPKTNSQWATFILGASNPFNQRYPQFRLLKNHCRFNFNYPSGNDLFCGWAGTGFTTCGKTLTDCRDRSNSTRFGGSPGVGSGGLRI